MKNIVRNNLWMIIVSWCLLLNGYPVWGLIVGVLASIYLIVNIKYPKTLRILSVSLLCFSFSYLLGNVSDVGNLNYFNYFAMVISVNVGLLNERIYKERLATLYPIFIVIFTTLIIFLVTALLLPYNSILVNAKTNMYSLIILIFIPYASEILVSLLVKEYNKKRLLDKLKVHKSIDV